MPASIIAKVLPLLMVVATISPSTIHPRIADVIGTSTTWEIDSNNDRIIDGTLVVENVTTIWALNLASDFRCVLSWENISLGSEWSINNATLEWMGIPLLVDAMQDPGELFVDYFTGVNREFVPIEFDFNGNTWMLAYDKVTGLLLGMYQENGTGLLGPVRDYYMRASITTVFFNPVQVEPYMIWVAIAVTSVAVVYTVAVTARDANVRKKRACFRDDCW